MIVLLLTAGFFLGFIQKYASKKLQIDMPPGNIAYGLYTFVTALISGVAYVAMTGFEPDINKTVVLVSFVYGVICIINVPVTFSSLKHNGIFLNSIFSMAGGNILPMILSYIIFREKQSYVTVFSAFCILIASALPMISKQKSKRFTPVGFVCALMTFLIAGSANMIVKITAELRGPESVLTLNFLTNVFMLVISVVWILFFTMKNKSIDEIKEFKLSHHFMTLIISFSGAVGGYVATLMYSIVDVIPSIIISASVNTLITVTASFLPNQSERV